jgi:hypothetical protein
MLFTSADDQATTIGDSALLGKNKGVPRKTEQQQSETAPATVVRVIDTRPLRLRPPIYTKATAGAVIAIEPDIIALADAGRLCHAPYLSKTLLVAEVAGDAIDMPDTVIIRFEAEEHPHPPRECWRLTVNLFETVLQKCVASEEAWKRGDISDVDYQTIRARFAVAEALYDRLPKTVAFDGSFPATG